LPPPATFTVATGDDTPLAGIEGLDRRPQPAVIVVTGDATTDPNNSSNSYADYELDGPGCPTGQLSVVAYKVTGGATLIKQSTEAGFFAVVP
jgi:hypothetical protein